MTRVQFLSPIQAIAQGKHPGFRSHDRTWGDGSGRDRCGASQAGEGRFAGNPVGAVTAGIDALNQWLHMGCTAPHTRLGPPRTMHPCPTRAHRELAAFRTLQRADRIGQHQCPRHEPHGLRLHIPSSPHQSCHARPRRPSTRTPRPTLHNPTHTQVRRA
jgi:hypothetical protein